MEIYNYLIAALKSVVNNTPFKFDKTIDYDKLYEISCGHQVQNIVSYALIPYKNALPDTCRVKFDNSLYAAAVKDTRQTLALKALAAEFEINEIDYMVLKGYLMKFLYPSTDMRIMGDIDILLKPQQAEKAKLVLKNLGYIINYENVREFNCVKDKFINMEIHLDMVSAQYKKLHDYYKNIWDKAINAGGHEYKISDEDYFIYHIVHLAKHYKGTGAGLRPFLDVYIFIKNKSGLKFDYIFSELKKIDLDIFAKNVIALSDMWFGEGARSSVLSEMEEYILTGGVYGLKEREELQASVKSIKDGKIHTYMSILFPSMHVMSSLYPRLLERKYLLWFYYIKRIFDKLFAKEKLRKAAFEKLSEVSSEKEAQAIVKHLNAVGLGEDSK